MHYCLKVYCLSGKCNFYFTYKINNTFSSIIELKKICFASIIKNSYSQGFQQQKLNYQHVGSHRDQCLRLHFVSKFYRTQHSNILIFAKPNDFCTISCAVKIAPRTIRKYMLHAGLSPPSTALVIAQKRISFLQQQHNEQKTKKRERIDKQGNERT